MNDRRAGGHHGASYKQHSLSRPKAPPPPAPPPSASKSPPQLASFIVGAEKKSSKMQRESQHAYAAAVALTGATAPSSEAAIDAHRGQQRSLRRSGVNNSVTTVVEFDREAGEIQCFFAP